MNGNQDVWLLDTTRGAPIRFTSDPSTDASPIWSPDGSRIVFNSNRRGVYDFYEKSATGGTEKLLLATSQIKVQSDWSADGKFLLYRTIDPKMGYDLRPCQTTEIESRSPFSKRIPTSVTDSFRLTENG